MLTWPQRINPVFDQNEELIEASKMAGEKSMLERKEKVASHFIRLTTVKYYCLVILFHWSVV